MIKLQGKNSSSKTLICNFCGKEYLKKNVFDKHVISCELTFSVKNREKNKINDNYDDFVPNNKKLYQMILELGDKINRIENKIDNINKLVIKKKKINILDWLNLNCSCDILFENLYEYIEIEDYIIDYLFENSVTNTLHKIFSETIYKGDVPNTIVKTKNTKNTDNILNTNFNNLNMLKFPIIACNKKSCFYVFTNTTEEKYGESSWIELSKENFSIFIEKIYYKLFKVFCDWKKDKKKNNNNEKFQILCDKVTIKITSVNIKCETFIQKIWLSMYNKMKMEIKAIVEYEF